jgi:hypothetical protein
MLTHLQQVIAFPVLTVMIVPPVLKLVAPLVHILQLKISLATLVLKDTTALPFPATLLLILEVHSRLVELQLPQPAQLTTTLRRVMHTVLPYPQVSESTTPLPELRSVLTRHTQTGAKLFAPNVLSAIFALRRLTSQLRISHAPVAPGAKQVSRLSALQECSELKKEELLKLTPAHNAPPATTVLLAQNISSWLLAHLVLTVSTVFTVCALKVQPVMLFTVCHSMTVRPAQPVALAEKVQLLRQLVDRHTTAHLVRRLLVSHVLLVPVEAGRQERLTQVSV